MHLKWPWLLCVSVKMLQKQFKFKIIEINRDFLDDKNIIAPKQQLLGLYLFYAFKMAVAIVFLHENAVEAN